jgi:hypothetical protein
MQKREEVIAAHILGAGAVATVAAGAKGSVSLFSSLCKVGVQ